MSLIQSLSNKLWQEAQDLPSEGFKEYLISRSQKDGGNYKYVIYEDDDSPPRTVVLQGLANDTRDPLKGYRRVELAVKSINDKLYITGIKNGDDCVLKITDEQT